MRLGLAVEETASPFGDLIEADRAIVALETDISGLRKLAAGREHLLSPPLRALLRREWSATAFTDAITVRKAAVNAMARFMDRFDLILTPTAPLPPFAIDRDGPGMIDGIAVADDAWTPAPLSRQPHRPARRQRAGGLDEGPASPSACRSSAAGSTIACSSPPRPRTNGRCRGAIATHRSRCGRVE